MKFLVIAVFCLYFSQVSSDDGFSYQNFRGPVSGQIREVVVPSQYPEQGAAVDFVAKPDYLYFYGVEDPKTGNSQAHRQTRDGDEVAGEYRVLQADGLVRVVKYSADGENGFRASVSYVDA